MERLNSLALKNY